MDGRTDGRKCGWARGYIPAKARHYGQVRGGLWCFAGRGGTCKPARSDLHVGWGVDPPEKAKRGKSQQTDAFLGAQLPHDSPPMQK